MPINASGVVSTYGDLICCPCGGDLTVGVSEREIACIQCARKIAIKDDILVMSGLAEATDPNHALRATEEATRDKQAGIYDFSMLFRLPSRKEQGIVAGELSSRRWKAAAEVGCGTGRITELMAKNCDRIVAMDRSFVSIQVCQSRLKRKGLAENVLLIQADVVDMPLRDEAYDLVLSAQVIQHVPGEGERERIMARIAEALQPTGRLILTLYEWRPSHARYRQKEGQHPGGISFHRFTNEEFRALIEPCFTINKVQSCLGKLLVGFANKK